MNDLHPEEYQGRVTLIQVDNAVMYSLLIYLYCALHIQHQIFKLKHEKMI